MVLNNLIVVSIVLIVFNIFLVLSITNYIVKVSRLINEINIKQHESILLEEFINDKLDRIETRYDSLNADRVKIKHDIEDTSKILKKIHTQTLTLK